MTLFKNIKSTITIFVLVGGFFFITNTSFAAIADCLTVSGNLIKNCSFETPGANPPAGFYPHSTGNFMFPAGYNGLSDWKIIAPVKMSNVGYFMPGFPTPSGVEIVELSGFVDKFNLNMNGEQPGSGVEQTVYGLTPGEHYQLKFSQGYLTSFPSAIMVRIGGTPQGTFVVNEQTPGTANLSTVLWKEQIVPFTADATSTTIRFTHILPQPGGKIVVFGSALDNVSLTPVSSPAVIPPSVAMPPATSSPVVPVVPVPAPSPIPPPDATIQPINLNLPVVAPLVTIASNFSNPFYAKKGNIVTLNYTLSKTPISQQVKLGDQTVTPVCIGATPTFQCSAAFIVTKYIPLQDGKVKFSININNGLRSTITQTTDGSYVIVDRSGSPLPTTPPVVTPPPAVLPPVSPQPVVSTPSSSATTNPPSNNSLNNSSNNQPSGSSNGGSNIPVPPNVLPLNNPSGSNGSGGGVNQTSVWGTSYTANGPLSCSISFTRYLRKGDNNNEVAKIQKFLNRILNRSLLDNGVFESSTDQAVRQFQQQYEHQIIIPWKIMDPTGWWYQSTRSYANYLEGCSEGPVRLDNGTWMLDGEIITAK